MEQKEELECAQRKHDEQKMELIRTLNELNKRLDEKEKLMHNMQESDGMISQLRTDYEVCPPSTFSHLLWGLSYSFFIVCFCWSGEHC